MQGRRRPSDIDPSSYEPGDYGLTRATAIEPIYDAWWVRTPNGLLGRLTAPEDNPGNHHEVQEHEDGTISVLPQPGNSNSILVEGWIYTDPDDPSKGEERSWHGYIRHGIWEPC